MKEVYASSDRIVAERLRNFLIGHSIGAEVSKRNSENTGPGDHLEYLVLVADDQEQIVRRLVDEFDSMIAQTSEGTSVVVSDSDELDAISAPPPRRRYPWLTVAFCIICLAASVGLWGERNATSNEAARRHGYRDAHDVVDGSYWAIFPALVLHPTIEHLVINLAAILVLGSAVERVYGSFIWLSVALPGILVSTAAELGLAGQMGIGASGLAYCFLGFALVASIRRSLGSPAFLVMAAIWLLFGAVCDLAAALDYWLFDGEKSDRGIYAHLFGLGVGVLTALALVVPWNVRVTRGTLAAIVVLSLIPFGGSPWLSSWLLERGDHMLQRGYIDSALGWYSRAVEKLPSAQTYSGRGLARMYDAKVDDAIEDFDTAISLDPGAPFLRAHRALAHELNSDFAAALADINQEIQFVAASPYAFVIRSELQSSLQDFVPALRDLETAFSLQRTNPDGATDRAQLLISRAIVRIELCEFASALDDLNKAIRLKPDGSSARLLRAALFSEISEHEKARSDLGLVEGALRDKLTRGPNDPWLRCDLAEWGLLWHQLDGSEACLIDASLHAEHAAKGFPDFWIAWEMLGRVQIAQRKFAEADRTLARSVELNPKSVGALVSRGKARHALGRADEALVDLNDALGLNPRSAIAYQARAIVHVDAMRHAAALSDLNKALQLNARCAECYRIRGKTHLALGEQQAATEDMDRAAALEAPGAERSR